MAKLDLRKPLMPALVVTAALWVVNYIMSLIGVPQRALFASVEPVSAITGTVGERAIAWLGGIVPIAQINIPTFATLFISAYLIILVGALIIDMFKLPTAKWPNPRVGMLASVILYGAAVFYVLIVGMVMQQWQTIIGLALHTIIVAYVAGFVADMANIKV